MKRLIMSGICVLSLISGSLSPTMVYAKQPVKTQQTAKKKQKAITLYVDSVTQKRKTLKAKGVKKWTTSNKKIVTVKKGKLTAKKKGKAVIKAKMKKKTVKWNVSVKKVSLNHSSAKLKVGQTVSLKLNGEKIQSIKSSNKKIAVVQKNGKVRAVKKGSTTVKVRGKNKRNYSARIQVIDKSVINKEINQKEKITNPNKLAAMKAAQYSYTIEPVLAPFCKYYLVETKNPDVQNIRFCGVTESGKEAALSLDYREYTDIQYYNEATKEVRKDTYIFMLGNKDTDSIYALDDPIKGNLELMATGEKYVKPDISYSGGFVSMSSAPRYFADSGKTYTLPDGLESSAEYLIHTYADGVNGSLYDKLDAVEKGLSKLAVYPKTLVDRNQVNNHYPALCVSRYPELGLNEHLDIYKRAKKEMFTEYVYPFLLDSLGFPGEMSAVAKKLDPNCEVKRGYAHYTIKVIQNDQSRFYGGAGKGTPNNLFLDLIGKDYQFNGNDLLSLGMNAIGDKYTEYGTECDRILNDLKEKLSSDSIAKVISQTGNHSWVRVGIEGERGHGFGYYYINYHTSKNDASYLSDCWVDGRYIGDHECMEKGAKFSDHPKASIFVPDEKTVDSSNNEVIQDNIYEYNERLNVWIRSDSSYIVDNEKYTLADLDSKNISYLTEDQVKNMNVDRNTDEWPTSGYIYDGTAEPGTAF